MKETILYLEALKQQMEKRMDYYQSVLENSQSDLLKEEFESRIDELKIVISEIDMKICFLKS